MKFRSVEPSNQLVADEASRSSPATLGLTASRIALFSIFPPTAADVLRGDRRVAGFAAWQWRRIGCGFALTWTLRPSELT
jgi:hypothetical protein